MRSDFSQGESHNSSTPVPFELPAIDLDFFSEDKKEVLAEYLSKSSEWHVFPLGKFMIAIRRKNSNNCNPIQKPLPSSYWKNEIPPLKDSYFIFPSETYQPSISDTHVVGSSNKEARVSLKLSKNSYKSKSYLPKAFFDSSLILESKNRKLLFYTFESSDDQLRQYTKKVLAMVSGELRKLIATSLSSDLSTNNIILPPGSWIKSPKQIISIKRKDSGGHSVSGFINAKTRGFVYLKLFIKGSSKPFISDRESTNAEYVGWSMDSNEKFNFCLGIDQLKSTYDTGKETLIEVQLWFKPSDGSSEKLLYRKDLIDKP